MLLWTFWGYAEHIKVFPVENLIQKQIKTHKYDNDFEEPESIRVMDNDEMVTPLRSLPPPRLG